MPERLHLQILGYITHCSWPRFSCCRWNHWHIITADTDHHLGILHFIFLIASSRFMEAGESHCDYQSSLKTEITALEVTLKTCHSLSLISQIFTSSFAHFCPVVTEWQRFIYKPPPLLVWITFCPAGFESMCSMDSSKGEAYCTQELVSLHSHYSSGVSPLRNAYIWAEGSAPCVHIPVGSGVTWCKPCMCCMCSIAQQIALTHCMELSGFFSVICRAAGRCGGGFTGAEGTGYQCVPPVRQLQHPGHHFSVRQDLPGLRSAYVPGPQGQRWYQEHCSVHLHVRHHRYSRKPLWQTTTKSETLHWQPWKFFLSFFFL